MNNELSDYYEFIQPDKHFVAFFIAVNHFEEYEIYKIFNEYKDEIGKYVIAKEIALDGTHVSTNGEHFHFVAEMTIKTYHKLTKRFKEKYKLNGSAKGGKTKQYGKVNDIKDISRMIAYCMKDGDFQTNLTATEVEGYKKISFKKPEKKVKDKDEFCRKIANELMKGVRPDYMWNYDDDAEKIVDSILKHLGMVAKIFDEQKLKQFYYGVFNMLQKTNREHVDFRKRFLTVIGKKNYYL